MFAKENATAQYAGELEHLLWIRILHLPTFVAMEMESQNAMHAMAQENAANVMEQGVSKPP